MTSVWQRHVRALAVISCASTCAAASVSSAPQGTRLTTPIGDVGSVWHIGGQGRGAPAADQSTAYFLSTQNKLLAVNTASGKVLWKRAVQEQQQLTQGSTLLVAGSLVLVGAYDVLAFSRLDGALRWRFVPTEGYGPGLYLGDSEDGLVFTGSPAGRIYAVEEATGRLRWSATVSTEGKTTVFAPTVDGDLVAAGYTHFVAPPRGGVVAFNAQTGQECWRTDFPRDHGEGGSTGWAGGPILLKNVIVAASGDGTVYGFDRASGAISWSIPPVKVQQDPHFVVEHDFRALASSGGTLFAGSLTGYVVAYDLSTREERWRYSSLRDGSVTFKIRSDDETVFVPYFSGTLVAVGTVDGVEQWRIDDEQAGFYWPPATTRDGLFLASSKLGFFGFDRSFLRGRNNAHEDSRVDTAGHAECCLR